ncbi:hypothetical protein M422DRAFT_197151, partial [Sphaerobolus stellatus SS14]
MERYQPSLLLALGGIIVIAFITLSDRGRRLPGPSRLPFIGNVHQTPLSHPWITFADWKQLYGKYACTTVLYLYNNTCIGNIFQFDIFGKPAIVISSYEVAKELLDKRALLYSDRPRMIMAGEMVGMDRAFPVKSYDDQCRRQRTLVASEFTQSKSQRFHALQEYQSRMLVSDLLKQSESFDSVIQYQMGSLIMRVVYGYRVKSRDDVYLNNISEGMHNFAEAALPGNFLVDTLPICK